MKRLFDDRNDVPDLPDAEYVIRTRAVHGGILVESSQADGTRVDAFVVPTSNPNTLGKRVYHETVRCLKGVLYLHFKRYGSWTDRKPPPNRFAGSPPEHGR